MGDAPPPAETGMPAAAAAAACVYIMSVLICGNPFPPFPVMVTVELLIELLMEAGLCCRQERDGMYLKHRR